MKIKIEKKDVTDLKIWFNRYVKGFRYDDPELQQNIDLKVGHTKRVCAEILKIGKETGLNDEELNLAETTALLHDIGRFRQFSDFRTFSDRKSVDHAELGIKILAEEKVLDHLNPETSELIICTIRSHNKAALPDGKTDECHFFTKMLRDADKLDIWRMFTLYYYNRNVRRNDTFTLNLPDTPGYSGEACNDLLNQKIVTFEHVKNLNDLKLLHLSWIFDVNFRVTADYINKNRYLEKILGVLPDSQEISDIYNKLILYRDNKKFV